MLRTVWQYGAPPLRSTPSDRPKPGKVPAYSSLPDESLNATPLPVSAAVIDRERSNTKLHLRELIPRVSYAPYADDADYIEGLANEDQFLRPKSSHDPS